MNWGDGVMGVGRINKNYKIPIYIKFYYNNWNNKDINRFSDEMKDKIKTNSAFLLE